MNPTLYKSVIIVIALQLVKKSLNRTLKAKAADFLFSTII